MLMDHLKTGAAAALWVALLVPLAATAQEPPTGLVLTDAAGDLADLVTGDPIDGLGYTDITGLEVTVEGDQLSVRFDVAEVVPEAPDPLFTTVIYYLGIDTDGDDSEDYHLGVRSEEGWHATIFDYDAGLATQLGDAVVVAGSLTASTPVSSIGSPPEICFRALMQATDTPDPTGDPLTFTEWQDRVPDGEDEWVALGSAQPEDISMFTVESLLERRAPDISKVLDAVLTDPRVIA